MKGLIFTYALTYGGSVLALFRPYYGFLVYVCFGILRPTSLWFYSVPEGNYSRVIAIALILGWLLNGMGSWQFGRARAVLQWLLLFWIVCLVSTWQAPHFPVAWDFLERLTKILIPLLIGISLIDSIEKLKQLVWVIVLSQGFLAYEMNMVYFSGYNRFYFDGYAGLDNNGVALTMVTGVGLAFFLALHESSLIRKSVAAGVLLLMTHGVMLSFSRGGVLALIICAAFIFIMIPKRPLYLTAFAIALLIGLRLAGPQVVERFATVFVSKEERDNSAESRLGLWRACVEEMLASPLVGIGPEHFRRVVHNYGFEADKAAHTTWLQIGAELGVVGLISIAAFFFLIIYRLWPLARSNGSDEISETAALARMVICSLMGYFVAAQFVSVALVEIPYYVAAVGMGLLKITSAVEPESELEAPLEVVRHERLYA